MTDQNPFLYTLVGGSKAGTVVTWKHPDLIDLFCDGQIPDVLTGIVEQLIEQSLENKGLHPQPNPDREVFANGNQALAFLHWIVQASTVDPVISNDLTEVKRLREAGQNAIHTTQCDPTDIYALYYRALGVAVRLADQFQEQERPPGAVEPVPNQSEDVPTSEQPAAHPADAAVGGVPGGHGGESVGRVRGEQVGGTRRKRNPRVDG